MHVKSLFINITLDIYIYIYRLDYVYNLNGHYTKVI